MKEKRVMNMVECSGTPHEAGRQYGEASRNSLRNSLGLCIATLTGVVSVTRNQN